MRRRRRQRRGDRRDAGRPLPGIRRFRLRGHPLRRQAREGLGLDGAECCSFSGRIPGVVDGLSAIYEAFRAESSALVELDISDDEALDVARALIRKGFPVGPSSGLNFRAAMMAADRLGPEAHIVTVFPDRMERYFSTELFIEVVASSPWSIPSASGPLRAPSSLHRNGGDFSPNAGL